MRKICFIALIAVFVAAQAGAALIAYEDFNYDVTGNISGKSGGSGWGGNWTWVSSEGDGITVEAGSSFGDLPVSGNRAVSNEANNNSGGRYSRSLASAITIGTGSGQKSELWVSWLASAPYTDKAVAWLNFYNGGTGGTLINRAGKHNWLGEPEKYDWLLQVNNVNTSTGVQSTSVDMLVLHYYVDGTDTAVDLYVGQGGDRDVLNTGSFAASGTITGSATIDTIDLWSEHAPTSGNRINATWDEIRFGDTAADVGVIPEPASLGLIGLIGLIALLRRSFISRIK